MFHSENLVNFMKTVPTRALLTAILAAVSYATHASGADEPSGVSVTIRYDDPSIRVRSWRLAQRHHLATGIAGE